jgi:hypothetical protein
MGSYYQYALVHGRVLIWWSDNDGRDHSMWVEGPEADKVYGALNKLDMAIQRELAAATKIKD